MRIKNVLMYFLFAFVCCPLIAQAEESCTEENQLVLDGCIENARTACEASVPECEASTITPEATLALVEEKCGLCADARNFGKFNSCLKKVRNGIRRLGALDLEIKDTLKTARTECKQEKKPGKGGKDDKNDDEEEEELEE